MVFKRKLLHRKGAVYVSSITHTVLKYEIYTWLQRVTLPNFINVQHVKSQYLGVVRRTRFSSEPV